MLQSVGVLALWRWLVWLIRNTPAHGRSRPVAEDNDRTWECYYSRLLSLIARIIQPIMFHSDALSQVSRCLDTLQNYIACFWLFVFAYLDALYYCDTREIHYLIN